MALGVITGATVRLYPLPEAVGRHLFVPSIGRPYHHHPDDQPGAPIARVELIDRRNAVRMVNAT